MTKIKVIGADKTANCGKPCPPNTGIKNCLTSRQREILASADKFGIPIWSRSTTYVAGSIVADYVNGVLTFYQAVKPNKATDPQSDSGENWVPIDIGGGSGGGTGGDNRWRTSLLKANTTDGKNLILTFDRGDGTTTTATVPFKTINGQSIFGSGDLDITGAKGDKGDPGKDGIDGKDGAPGKDGASITAITPEVSEDGKSFVLHTTLSDGNEITTGAIPLPSGGGTGGTVEIVDTVTLPAGEPARTEETADSTPENRKYILYIPEGEKGDKGDPGADGAPGKDGADGAPGKDGADGAPGKDGADGAPGKDGASVESMEAILTPDGSAFSLKSTLTNGDVISTGNIALPVGGGDGGGTAATVSIVDTVTIPAGEPARTEETSDSTPANRKYILYIPQGTNGTDGASIENIDITRGTPRVEGNQTITPINIVTTLTNGAIMGNTVEIPAQNGADGTGGGAPSDGYISDYKEDYSGAKPTTPTDFYNDGILRVDRNGSTMGLYNVQNMLMYYSSGFNNTATGFTSAGTTGLSDGVYRVYTPGYLYTVSFYGGKLIRVTKYTYTAAKTSAAPSAPVSGMTPLMTI